MWCFLLEVLHTKNHLIHIKAEGQHCCRTLQDWWNGHQLKSAFQFPGRKIENMQIKMTSGYFQSVRVSKFYNSLISRNFEVLTPTLLFQQNMLEKHLCWASKYAWLCLCTDWRRQMNSWLHICSYLSWVLWKCQDVHLFMISTT